MRKERFVLLVHNAADPGSRYSHFLRELLTLEGFFDVEELDATDLPARLAADDWETILLPRTNLPAATSDLLVAHIHRGGRLIALQPDAVLLKRLGCTPSYAAIRQGWLTFDDDGLLAGLPLDPVQVVVPTVRWTAPAGATTVATVAERQDPFVSTDGITHLKAGDGEAALVAFDLAKAVARLRFGDPELAGIQVASTDHIYRPHELLIGQLDPRQLRTAQADILTAVLGRMVETLAPQPRVWYYPEPDQRSVLLQTSDDDWSTIEQFDHMIDVLKRYDATCTYYIVPLSHVTRGDLDRWEQAGHVFSVHPAMDADTKSASPSEDPQPLWVPDMVRRNVERHRAQYGRPVNTVRNHAIRWVNYMDLPRLHAALDIRAEANYVCVPPFPAGFLCGSGRLIPYVDVTGEVIDHFQIPTMWTEEALINPHHGSSINWSLPKARNETNVIIQRAAQRYFTPVTINSHPVSFATYSQPLIEDNWRHARELNVPIISADAWTAWTDARRALSVTHNGAGWLLRADRAIPGLTVLLPTGTGASATGTGRQRIWGRDYEALRLTNLTAGEDRAINVGESAIAGRAG